MKIRCKPDLGHGVQLLERLFVDDGAHQGEALPLREQLLHVWPAINKQLELVDNVTALSGIVLLSLGPPNPGAGLQSADRSAERGPVRRLRTTDVFSRNFLDSGRNYKTLTYL